MEVWVAFKSIPSFSRADQHQATCARGDVLHVVPLSEAELPAGKTSRRGARLELHTDFLK
jgi:hypothetical protein